MDAEKIIKVLLIRKRQTAHSPLMDRLGGSGCECRVATSNQEVGVLLDNHGFDLVLGPIRLHGDSLYPLIEQLEGSRTTLFFSQAVENGCWWLPAMWRGLNCFGAPAYRSGEFATVLDKTIEEIRSSAPVVTQPVMAFHQSSSIVNLPYSRGVPLAKLAVSAKSVRLATRKAVG
jgi:hypothetical protein